MGAGTEQKVAADTFVPPVEVERLDTHRFGTHELLFSRQLCAKVGQASGSPLAAYAALLPFYPSWLMFCEQVDR
jgi:hypothetical protein